ncbi:MAG: hypothetical protein U9R17_07575 [Thermodesulfobacteriota bacterium]|nr:hypothetical protein [Thermodesulfobacteriota bacterium]
MSYIWIQIHRNAVSSIDKKWEKGVLTLPVFRITAIVDKEYELLYTIDWGMA